VWGVADKKSRGCSNLLAMSRMARYVMVSIA